MMNFTRLCIQHQKRPMELDLIVKRVKDISRSEKLILMISTCNNGLHNVRGFLQLLNQIFLTPELFAFLIVINGLLSKTTRDFRSPKVTVHILAYDIQVGVHMNINKRLFMQNFSHISSI